MIFENVENGDAHGISWPEKIIVSKIFSRDKLHNVTVLDNPNMGNKKVIMSWLPTYEVTPSHGRIMYHGIIRIFYISRI
jgi:hypothetical protein